MYISSYPFKVSLRTATWSLSTGSLHCSAAVQSMEWYLCPEEFKRKDNVRPLVVLFGWLLAKSRHLHKYGELYHQHGADVITLKIEAMEVLRPRKAEQLATKVLNELISEQNRRRPVIIHGFSVGGYLYSQVLHLMETNAQFTAVKDRILGQVFDSPVDLQGLPYGLSNAVTTSPFLRWSMQSTIELYLLLTARYTTNIYIARSKLFFTNPVRSTSLFLFSKDDKVADAKAVQVCAEGWRDKLNMQVKEKCFDSSPHVSHFYVHHKEYTETITNFLKDINISTTVLNQKFAA